MSAVILFDEAKKAIRAEYILKKQGLQAKLVAPPSGIRRGCDLSVKVEDSWQLQAMQILDSQGISYIDLAAFTGGQGPVQLTEQKDLGEFVMVRAGNMKLTFSKDSGTIVNISGGGCPDIPYMANRLVSVSLTEAESPLIMGTSLCAYLLDRALAEAKKIFLD